MSKYIYSNHFKDLSGNAVGSGTITVFAANSTALATVYSSSGSSAINGSAVTSDSTDGFFKFWIDTDDYATTQKFKIKLTKDGFTTKEYDDLKIFPEVSLVGSNAFSGNVAWFGNTAQSQFSSTGTTSGFTKGTTTNSPVNPDASFTGGTGATAYTIGDIILALKNYGLMSC